MNTISGLNYNKLKNNRNRKVDLAEREQTKEAKDNLKQERVQAFKEKYKDILSKKKEVIKEDVKEDEVKITPKQYKTYAFIYKTVKNLFKVIRPSDLPLLLFLLLDLLSLSQVDFDKTKEDDQREEYNKNFKQLITKFVKLSKKENLTNEDIVLELL